MNSVSELTVGFGLVLAGIGAIFQARSQKGLNSTFRMHRVFGFSDTPETRARTRRIHIVLGCTTLTLGILLISKVILAAD